MAQRQPLSNLVRLAPLRLDDLPRHADLTGPGPGPDSTDRRPDLFSFVTSMLDDGVSFLAPATFSATFKHQSTKSAPPSAAHVDVFTYSIPFSALGQIQWTAGPNSGGVSRSKPASASNGAEHWFARKSVHKDISSRSANDPGHASWDEFVFGLRNEHSEHERDFTPTLYDAHKVLDWNGELTRHTGEAQDETRTRTRTHLPGAQHAYTGCTMAIYEMCHAIPAPLDPRCFAVLVVTAGVDAHSFVAVTVPVDLTPAPATALYSSGRNVREGKDAQQRKPVCRGVYAAVETVRRDTARQQVEWVMATASDAKGILPMWAQKLGIPGAIVKDVGYFIKWIKGVDEKDVAKHTTETTGTKVSTD